MTRTLLFVLIWRVVTSTIHIASSGIDKDDCGKEINPCATIGFASIITMYSIQYKHMNDINMTVNGQNVEQILKWQNKNYSNLNISDYYITIWKPKESYSICTLFVDFNKTITITFNSNIKTINDWFPDICFNNMENKYLFRVYNPITEERSITFNGLVIDNINLPLEKLLIKLYDKWTLVLNDCLFYNISKYNWSTPELIASNDITSENYQHLIVAPSIIVQNTIFDSIILDTINTDFVGKTSFLYLFSVDEQAQLFYMNNSKILRYENNIGSFLIIYGRNFFSNTREIYLYNTTFDNISDSRSIIESKTYFSSWRISINIKLCNFFNINLGSILLTNNGHDIFISNISITTKQLVSDMIGINKNDYLISLFDFGGDDEIVIQHTHLKYMYDLIENCWYRNETFQVFYITKMNFVFYHIYCDIPIQFIANDGGLAKISEFIVSNDITYNKSREFQIAKKFDCTVFTTLCRFYFDLDNQEYTLIYNSGELIIDNFYIRGTGIHSTIIRNKGNTYINNAISQYTQYFYDSTNENECTSTNRFCGYVADTLNNQFFFRNDGNDVCGGILQVNNSFIYGVAVEVFYLTGGKNYIKNTVIKQSYLAIASSPDVEYLYIENVHFIKVGSFYQSYLVMSQSIGYPGPITISSQMSIIKNCNFSFYDPWGFIVGSVTAWSMLFSSAYIPDQNYSQTYTTILVNNTFELNMENDFTTIAQVIQLKKTVGAVLMQIHLDKFGDVVKSFVKTFDPTDVFYTGSLLWFDSDTVLNLVGNTFLGNPLQNDTAFILIVNNNINCMSNNIIHGYALNLQSGMVTSCYRNKLLDIVLNTTDSGKQQCWNGGLKTLDDTYSYSESEMDYFIATKDNIEYNIPLITINSTQSIFAAERILFSVTNDATLNSNMRYSTINIEAGIILMFDVQFTDTNIIDLLYSNDSCQLDCFQVFNKSDQSTEMNILQIYGNCMYQEHADNIMSLLSSSRFSLVNHWSPVSIELILKDEYYPGGKLTFNYTIFDAFNNEITKYDQIINILLESTMLNIHLSITVDENGYCEICEAGIFIPTLNADNIGIKYTINTYVENNELYVNDIEFTVQTCPPGYGIAGAAKQCEVCDNGYFSLYPGTSECINCIDPESNVDFEAISCNGKDNLLISYNYWTKIHENTTLYSSFCSSSQCCQNMSGCNYIKSSNTLCAYGRDPSSNLCSLCLAGYTEVIGSNTCRQCDKNNWWLLFIPIILAVIIVSVMVAFDPPTNAKIIKKQLEINYFKWLTKDEIQSLQITFLRPFVYFAQGISYITIQTGLWFYLNPVIRIFSFEFFTENTGESGICFLKSLKSLEEELWYLFFPFCMVVVVAIFFVINLHLKKQYNKNIIGLNMVWTIFLILIGNIVEKMLKILACTSIDNEIVHFYGAYKNCFEFLWFFALTVMIIVFIFWIVVWYKLYKMEQTKRNSRKSYLRTITKPYRLEYWYWEVILISRRTFIAFLVTLRYSNFNFIHSILLTILVIYFGLHIHCMPFKYERANCMDAVCLFLLIISLQLIIMGSYEHKYMNGISVLMTIIVLIPTLLFIFYCYLVLKHYIEIKKHKSSLNDNDARVMRMKARLTKSQLWQLKEINQGYSKLQKQDDMDIADMQIKTMKPSGVELQPNGEFIREEEISSSEKNHLFD